MEGAGESAGASVRVVDPSLSDLHGNMTTFGEVGHVRLLKARRERAINACVS